MLSSLSLLIVNRGQNTQDENYLAVAMLCSHHPDTAGHQIGPVSRGAVTTAFLRQADDDVSNLSVFECAGFQASCPVSCPTVTCNYQKEKKNPMTLLFYP